MRDHLVSATAVSLEEGEIEAVASVLRSGKLREGPVCREFEERFAMRVGARYAVSVSSGTAALHVAYAALLRPGDEVLVPSFTFIATASMVAMARGRPVLCDVDPHTFTLDVDDARARITRRTKAVAPVHLFGNPCDVDAVQGLAAERGLKVVWDAAQALGARFGGQDVGCLNDVVCYSFYPSKNITTAEGGMVVTNDPEIYERCRLLRSHGTSRKYHHSLLGFNYRLTDVMAALGIQQLDRLDGRLAARRANARRLTDRLTGVPGIRTPVEQPGGEHCFNVYSVLVGPGQLGFNRDELVRRLRQEGIDASVHYPRPLHRQPALEPFAQGASRPVSEDLSRRIVSLPVHPGLTSDDIEAVAAVVRVAATGKG